MKYHVTFESDNRELSESVLRKIQSFEFLQKRSSRGVTFTPPEFSLTNNVPRGITPQQAKAEVRRIALENNTKAALERPKQRTLLREVETDLSVFDTIKDVEELMAAQQDYESALFEIVDVPQDATNPDGTKIIIRIHN